MRQLKIGTNILSKKTNNISRYFKDIYSINDISFNEEELFKNIKENNCENSKIKIIRHNTRFVISVAKQYQYIKGIELEDLINEGNIGLIKAVNLFNSTHGFKFISYAVWWIRQSILAYITKNGRSIRLPSNKITLLSSINKKINELEQLYSTSNVKPYLDEYYKKNEIIGYEYIKSTENIKSLNDVFNDSDEELGNLISSDSKTPMDVLLINEKKDIIQNAISELSYTDREIIISYFGIFDRDILSKKEISDKFNINYSNFKPVLNKIFRKLKIKLRNYNNIDITLSKNEIRDIERNNYNKKISDNLIKKNNEYSKNLILKYSL